MQRASLGKIVVVLSVVLSVAAKDIDSRLATARKAFVTTADGGLSDTKPIATCLTKHLADTTPLTAVESKADAEVVLTVTRAHLPGNTARAVFGGIGKVELVASLPDGTKLWTGPATFQSTESSLHIDIACNLADGIADKLRAAMKKASK